MIIGLDMGGTHIDGVVIQDGQVIKTHKKPVDKDDLFTTMWTALEELVEDSDLAAIERINLSTTISTNAIVEGTTAPVGMVVQPGPGLIHDFSSCKGRVVTIGGYVDHRGVVVDDLDPKELEKALLLFKKDGMPSSAVISKFSTRNPEHEIIIGKKLLEQIGQVTLGHRISGILNFPRRVYTSYLNSAVSDQFSTFLTYMRSSLEKKGIAAPLYILKADGGTMDSEGALEKPVETVLSGPGASFLGMSALIPGGEDAILLDVGGTTTDIFFLADGVPLFEPLGATISDYKTLVRAIYSVSIGLGGDSSITVRDKNLVIGPQRRGMAYAFGGEGPTPTDAMICLGRMEAPQGAKAKAREGMEALGAKVSLQATEVATLVLATMVTQIKEKSEALLLGINSKPIYTIKELLHGKKVTPKAVHIIGGPAEALAPLLQEAYGLPCHFPENSRVANAIGAALAKPTIEVTLLADTALGRLSVPELGIYEKVPRTYSLEQAKERAVLLVRQEAIAMGSDEATLEIEITEQSSFNMIKNSCLAGKNIRVKAQVKPGIIHGLRSTITHES
ncbi:MAG: hydantoinase/oxoprolinase family protein [Sphaerochaeta sp.]|nr:hydantoinase/oxoprolinase family protein [Sphaerochaeta sp.]